MCIYIYIYIYVSGGTPRCLSRLSPVASSKHRTAASLSTENLHLFGQLLVKFLFSRGGISSK